MQAPFQKILLSFSLKLGALWRSEPSTCKPPVTTPAVVVRLFRRSRDSRVKRCIVKYWKNPKILKQIDCLRMTRWKPRLLKNRQFQWTGNGHSQLPLAELGKPSPNIDLLCTTGSNKHNFSLLDLDLNPRLAKVKVDPHAKNQGQRSNGSNRRAPTDRRTHTHTNANKNIISPATRLIMTGSLEWHRYRFFRYIINNFINSKKFCRIVRTSKHADGWLHNYSDVYFCYKIYINCNWQ